MHSALRIVAFSSLLFSIPSRSNILFENMHPLVSARNYSARVERYFPKETSDFFSFLFFFFFPSKKREKRQGQRHKWIDQRRWSGISKTIGGDISKTRGCFGETTWYIEFTSKPDESMISNDEGMGQTSDRFKFRPIYLRNVTARGWKAR